MESSKENCNTCLKGKNNDNRTRANGKLDLIHTDLGGPTNTDSILVLNIY